MKVITTSSNVFELIALSANLIPVPLIHTQIYPLIAKAVLEAHSLNIFEAFRTGPKSLENAAETTGLDPNALGSLLKVLAACKYLKYKQHKYSLTSMSRKWCLKSSPESLYNMQCYNQVTWNWLGHLETFLKTGKGIQYHDNLDEREWALYQQGMENIASTISKFITALGPKLDKPKKMLDIGGSHGLFSLEYVKKYPGMSATILDLPLAVDHAEPLLRKHYKGNNIRYKKGDARKECFGIDEYDIVFVGSVMHHFTAEQNTDLCNRISTALKTKGYLVIQEFLKAEEEVKSEMITSTMDLFFNLSSNSGGWSAKDLVQFQHASGLKPLRVKKFASVPGLAQLIAQKV